MDTVTDKPIGFSTRHMLGRMYARGDNKEYLRVGDRVMVHPTPTSTARHPFEAIIVIREFNWATCQHEGKEYKGKWEEICTHVVGGHSARLNEYLFNRLEFISR